MAEMSDESRKKLSLNVLPDAEKLSRIVGRAEENQKNQSAQSTVDDVTPVPLLPPTDWSIERKLLHGKIAAALKTIYDPEIPVDIYELGLIYSIDITPENKATIRMTLTAPGCPVADQLLREVESKVEAIPEITDARVDLVWDPPWSRDRMSEAARMHLGL